MHPPHGQPTCRSLAAHTTFSIAAPKFTSKEVEPDLPGLQRPARFTHPPTHLTGSLSPSMAIMGSTTFSTNSLGERAPVKAAAASAVPSRSCDQGVESKTHRQVGRRLQGARE